MLINDVTSQDIPNNHMRQLFNYWRGKKDDRAMPSRSDIRPEEIHYLLPSIVLIDVERHPVRFKARLVGTDIVDVIGADFTGMYFDTFPNIDNLLYRLETLLDNKCPYLVDDNVQWPEKSFRHYYALALPLSDNDNDINIIMLAMYYPWQEEPVCRNMGNFDIPCG